MSDKAVGWPSPTFVSPLENFQGEPGTEESAAGEVQGGDGGLGSPIGAVAAVLFGAGRNHKNPTTIFGLENLIKCIHF